MTTEPENASSPGRPRGRRLPRLTILALLLVLGAAFVPMLAPSAFLGEWEAEAGGSRIRYEEDGTVRATHIPRPWVGRWVRTGYHRVAVYTSPDAGVPFQEQEWRLRPFGMSAVVLRAEGGRSHRRRLRRIVHSPLDWLRIFR